MALVTTVNAVSVGQIRSGGSDASGQVEVPSGERSGITGGIVSEAGDSSTRLGERSGLDHSGRPHARAHPPLVNDDTDVVESPDDLTVPRCRRCRSFAR